MEYATGTVRIQYTSGFVCLSRAVSARPAEANLLFPPQLSSKMGLQLPKRQLQSCGYSVFDSAISRMQNAKGQFPQEIDLPHTPAMLTTESKTL
jgi:hypothetical protein